MKTIKLLLVIILIVVLFSCALRLLSASSTYANILGFSIMVLELGGIFEYLTGE
jgi:hypothetical protein